MKEPKQKFGCPYMGQTKSMADSQVRNQSISLRVQYGKDTFFTEYEC